MEQRLETYLVQGAEDHVVEGHPDGTSPIVFVLAEEGVVLGQTSDAVGRPESSRVVDQVEDRPEVRRRRREHAGEEREEGDVARIAGENRLV